LLLCFCLVAHHHPASTAPRAGRSGSELEIGKAKLSCSGPRREDIDAHLRKLDRDFDTVITHGFVAALPLFVRMLLTSLA
jgi:hypothetical protein